MAEEIGEVVDRPKKDKDHQRFLNFVKSWVFGTQQLYRFMRRDFEFVNGRQASNQNLNNVTKTGRELLFFNEIRPQFELLSGHRASQELDYVGSPRGREDRRLGTVVSHLLKASYELMKKSQVVRRMGDDADIGGLGAVWAGHTFDFAEDPVWGDLFLERVSPFSFVWDIWGTSPQYQDGKFMGHRSWVGEEEFAERWPEADKNTFAQWQDSITHMFGHNDDVHSTDSSFLHEMLNAEKKHIAVYRLYFRDVRNVFLVADSETGDIYEGGKTQKDARREMTKQLRRVAESQLGTFSVIAQNVGEQIVFILVDQEGSVFTDPQTQQPLTFETEENAKEFVNDQLKNRMFELKKTWKIWNRKRWHVKWVDANAFEILDKGELPVTTQMFPYRVYISRHLGDEVEDIEGVVRQVVDRQKEITKRYNHLADHLAHSAHSGWLIRAGDDRLKKQLELMGAHPGIVAQYASVPPQQIQPAQIPQGHFALLDANIGGIQRTTGQNAELLGFTSSSTVSGEAITARQRGGLTMLFGRIQNYMDFEKELAELVLYLIQTTMPVEKMRRIIGVWEAQNQSQILGQSVFLHPVTAQPVSEDEILEMLATVKNTSFDLILKPMPVDTTVKERQLQTVLQLINIINQSGRPMSTSTLRQVTHMADIPEMLAASLEADAQAEEQALAAEAQQAAIQDTIKQRQSQLGPNG